MTIVLMILLLLVGFLNAKSYGEGGNFLNLYCCVLNTLMFLVLYASEYLK